jgi:hypothetical protein
MHDTPSAVRPSAAPVEQTAPRVPPLREERMRGPRDARLVPEAPLRYAVASLEHWLDLNA